MGIKNLIFIFLLSLSIGGKAQTTTFSKVKHYLGNPDDTHCVLAGITQLDSNYFMIAVGIDTSFLDLYIFKTDLEGNLIKTFWQKEDSSWASVYSSEVILVDEDTNIVACSNQVLMNDNGRWVGNILKLTPDLDTIWTKTYYYPDTLPDCTGNEPDLVFTGMHEVDNGYIIMGLYNKNCIISHANFRAALIRIDKDGNELWRKMDMDRGEIYSFDVGDYDSYIFADYTGPFSVVKTDSLGSTIWETHPNDSTHLTAADVVVKDDYVIVVSPYAYKFQPDIVFGANIIKLDLATGNVIWDKFYRTFKSFQTMSLPPELEVKILSNDNIIIAGTVVGQYIGTNYYGYKGYLFSLNEYGDSLWCYRYKGYHDYDDTQFNEVIPTDDGGYMAVGYTLPYYPPNNTAAFLVKTDSIGMSPGVIPLNTREYAKSSNRINVFPNPAKDFISFSMDNNGSRGECRVEIFDAQGKKVLEAKRLPEANKINISKLNTGIYLFKLHNHSGTYTGQFFKK